jgi:tetratricopeptide (TPR) repeat protein
MTELTGGPSAGLARAHLLLQANRAEQALEELGRLPTDEAISPIAFELRAVALLRLERYAQAADAARRGLAGGPDPDLLGHLGAALGELGDYPEAERALLDGLAIAPQDPRLLCYYASLCLKVNQTDKAAKLLERAAAIAPHASLVYAVRIQLAFARGDDKLAQRISEEYLAEYPEEAHAHALHGQSARNRGQVNEAYVSLRQAAANDPADQDYAKAAITAKAYVHPLLVPLRPLYRIGPVKLWLAVVVTIFVLRRPAPALAGILGLTWFAYCVYSWVVPPIVTKLARRRFR